MSERYRCLMLGAGAMGSRWIRDAWQPFRDRMEFVGLVDLDPSALHEAGDWLGLPPAARFTDARKAFATIDADFCCIVTPPAHHREAVELACARGMDILSEKPIADTPEACGAISRAVNAAGIRMMVTQNYRYTRRILTLKQAVAELGAVNYAVARYASDNRFYCNRLGLEPERDANVSFFAVHSVAGQTGWQFRSGALLECR